MNENDSIISKESDFVLELLTENEAKEEFKEATSAININPAITWAKFVLTDDQPNGNSQQIPQEEFANLIKTGIYMPIKMAKGAVEETHKNSEPLGVITNLKEEVKDGVNYIVGLAALWSKERINDIKFIKNTYKESKKLRLSWEVLYRDSEFKDGVEILRGVVLKASTIVGRPAYGDRTPILAVAAKKVDGVDDLPTSAFLFANDDGLKLFPFKDRDGNIDTELLSSCLEDIENSDLPDETKGELTAKANELLANSEESVVQDITEDTKLDELETLKQELENIKAELATNKALIEEKANALTEKEQELVSLREFKSSIENEKAANEKFASIKTKFEEAGLKKDEEFFNEKREFLLSLDEKALEFMLQELVAFSSANNNNQSASASERIPNLSGKGRAAESDIKEIVKALNSLKAK
jgi:hypothetical protein